MHIIRDVRRFGDYIGVETGVPFSLPLAIRVDLAEPYPPGVHAHIFMLQRKKSIYSQPSFSTPILQVFSEDDGHRCDDPPSMDSNKPFFEAAGTGVFFFKEYAIENEELWPYVRRLCQGLHGVAEEDWVYIEKRAFG